MSAFVSVIWGHQLSHVQRPCDPWEPPGLVEAHWGALVWGALRTSARQLCSWQHSRVECVKGNESCCLWLWELYIWLLHSCIGGIWRVPRRCGVLTRYMCSFKLGLLLETLHCAAVQLFKSQITEALSYICRGPQDLNRCDKNNLTITTKKHTEERKLPCFRLCPLPYIHS